MFEFVLSYSIRRVEKIYKEVNLNINFKILYCFKNV